MSSSVEPRYVSGNLSVIHFPIAYLFDLAWKCQLGRYPRYTTQARCIRRRLVARLVTLRVQRARIDQPKSSLVEAHSHWMHASTAIHKTASNDRTTDQIGIEWTQHVERRTRSKVIGSKWLLILNNQRSYTTLEFRVFSGSNNIIHLWMPSHSSHRLQPLDVGCFEPLTRGDCGHEIRVK